VRFTKPFNPSMFCNAVFSLVLITFSFITFAFPAFATPPRHSKTSSSTPPPAIKWTPLLPRIRKALQSAAPHEYLENHIPITITTQADITGDGVPEAIVHLGSSMPEEEGPFYLVHLVDTQPTVVLADENGTPTPLTFRIQAGHNELGHFWNAAGFLPNARAFYGLSYTTDDNGSIYAYPTTDSIPLEYPGYPASYWRDKTSTPRHCWVEAYHWDPTSTTLRPNEALSKEVAQRLCPNIEEQLLRSPAMNSSKLVLPLTVVPSPPPSYDANPPQPTTSVPPHTTQTQTFAAPQATAADKSAAITRPPTTTWTSLLPHITNLLRLSGIIDSTSYDIGITQEIDLTGDGIPEAIVMLANGDRILMRLDHGHPIVARLVNREGRSFPAFLFSYSKVLGGSDSDILPKQHGFWTGTWSADSCGNKNPCEIEAYRWDPSTETFTFDADLTTNIRATYCQGNAWTR